MSINRPLVFVDLDDTLFQTARKMVEGTPRTIATLDVHRQPNGYMSPVQHSFINWLLASADVVPVTARSAPVRAPDSGKFSAYNGMPNRFGPRRALARRDAKG